MKKDYILQLENVTKIYPGVTALDNVSFKIERGKILSLVGENGAGKSTLLKVISGVIPKKKYEGNIYLNDNVVSFNSLKDSEKAKIAIIHQELAISPQLTLYENIYIGRYLRNKLGVVDWPQMIKNAKYYLDLVGLNIDPSTIAGTLSIANQQLLEIAKALSKKADLLILDEPTSSLNDKDSFALLDLIIKLKKEHNLTSMFVSHKLNEVAYLADAITVIRDGKHISDYENNPKSPISEEKLIKDIVGRELSSKFPDRGMKNITKEVKLEVKEWQVEHPKIKDYMVVKNASFKVHKGEIVGISGLVGSGRSELAKSLFGKSYGNKKNGEMLINGELIDFKNVKDSIKNGLMYASEDRKHEGLIQMFSVHWNINSASSHIYANKFGVYNKAKEIINSNKRKYQVEIKVPDINFPVNTLSGGNQQKVLIAKALSTEFETLIIDEPTKGIDVGSKYEIYNILIKLANQGKAIVVISSEIEELLGITDRIYVMSHGEIKGEIETKNANSEKIMQIAIGTSNQGKEINVTS